ncbi:amidohydrolase family protein [Microbacterium sp. MAHUQ-60]|uniref:amidohydrolase family protein n=1 Tax=unclassified Microbacterium TaxID=2609290 RepID=UPI0036077796
MNSAASEAAAPVALRIDTDVHNAMPDVSSYLPRIWRERWTTMGMVAGTNYENPGGVMRKDVLPPNGGEPGSDPYYLLSSHLDHYGIDYVILTGPEQIPLASDPDYMNAIATAYNDCTMETWLPVSERFRGSILVNADDPPNAAAEIRRCAGLADFAQVIIAGATSRPIGHRMYRPIFEAVSEVGLPLAMHPGTEGTGISHPPTPVGWPSRYMEWHNILPTGYMAQINSLVTEGVFETYPSLRFVAIEGGVAWLPHLMWRMDKNYKALRHTTPWLKRLPSEYILDHVRLTSQPIEEPDNPEHLAQILEMIDAGRTLMYSSDYPHWDFDNPDVVFTHIDPAVRSRIMGGTAMDLYGLHRKPKQVSLPPHSNRAPVFSDRPAAGRAVE